MRRLLVTLTASLCLAAAVWPAPAPAEHNRDFVFTDEDGHLVIRFVHIGPEGITPDQREEVLNAEFSTMVHDRLRADLRFEAEPVDSQWAPSVEHRLHKHLSSFAAGFSAVRIECRSATCRIVLEHTSRLPIAEHQAVMSRVEAVIQRFLDNNPSIFEPGFMLTAYDQESETPHIKVFLRRSAAG